MAAETDKELQQLKKRFQDLSERAWQQNMYTFSGFLSLAEQNALFEALGSNPKGVTLFGGMEHTERVMARFGDPGELGYEQPFPIVCLCVQPLMEKFADQFTHRDFLGAIMNLGIDRSTVGDIFLEGKRAWLFCNETIAAFICENLEQVKHTRVKCTIKEQPEELMVREPKEVDVTVASLRCDTLVAEVCKMSRSQSLELFRQKKIYVNGRLQENNSYLCKPGDTVSMRGFGRFIFRGEKYTTKKGRLVVTVAVF